MAKTAKKFYAVRAGRRPGIYLTWADCKAQVDGYLNARFKGFSSRAEAEAWLGDNSTAKPAPQPSSKTPDAAAPKLFETAPTPPELDESLKQIVIYTDGACTGNPGPGGYGTVLLYGAQREELSGGYRLTTNNRMEILACIVGLRRLKDRCAVMLYSDSQYVINTITKGWARGWKKRGWKKREGEPVKNPDLWEEMLQLCDYHQVRFQWVRGHSGDKENERCDYLARTAAADFNLAIDTAYEENL